MRKQGKVLPYAGVCDWIFTEQHLFVLNSTLRSSIGQMPGLVFAVIGEIVNKIKDVRNRKALDLRAAVDLSIQRAGTYAELADLKCLINPIQSTLGDRLTPGNWIFMPHYSRATFSGRFNFGGKEVEGEVSHIFSDKARTSYKGYKEAFPQIGNIELSDEIVPRHWIGCKGIS
ncbi:hypothetical protein HN911_13230 [Candidatus Bathyarchaeota archaeon]|nr:hypothetical protein [Candidatus Bathyarchaeota archaeon]